MKRVLITGAGSYVGTAVRMRLERELDRFQVDELDVRDPSWCETSFQSYDTVFHVAGIAHVSADPSMESLYMHVNRDLAIEVGQKAKAEGVSQIIFMSSAIVYGNSVPLTQARPITFDTNPAPVDFYGKSKLMAEDGLRLLEDDAFKVAILRCPMIYGPGCNRGNFPKLVEFARKAWVFPDFENIRSMLYIGNLSELVVEIIDRKTCGLLLPQNAEYVKTAEMVRQIAAATGNGIRLTKVFNPAIGLLIEKNEIIRKVFGSLYYDQACSNNYFDFTPASLSESIRDIAIKDGWVS